MGPLTAAVFVLTQSQPFATHIVTLLKQTAQATTLSNSVQMVVRLPAHCTQQMETMAQLVVTRFNAESITLV
jgi:hypothetical protein